jgi:hypothetical protein
MSDREDEADIFAAFGLIEDLKVKNEEEAQQRKHLPTIPRRVDPAPYSLQKLAKEHTEAAFNVLLHIMNHAEEDGTRLEAAKQVLDRGWGKAAIQIKAETIKYSLQDVEAKLLEHKEYVDEKMLEARRLEDEQLTRYLTVDAEVVEDSASRSEKPL